MYTYNIDPNKHLKEFTKYNDIFVTLRGVFLALILFCASFLVPYIGCNYQHILKTHPYTRYLVLFIVIYVSINLTDPDLSTPEHPIYALIKSLFVFFIFIILNKINTSIIVIALILFTLLIITSKYYNYYKQANLNTKTDTVKLEILYIIQISIALSILLLLFTSLFLSSTNKTESLKLKSCGRF